MQIKIKQILVRLYKLPIVLFSFVMTTAFVYTALQILTFLCGIDGGDWWRAVSFVLGVLAGLVELVWAYIAIGLDSLPGDTEPLVGQPDIVSKEKPTFKIVEYQYDEWLEKDVLDLRDTGKRPNGPRST